MAIELPRLPIHIFDSLEPHLAQQLSDWFERAHAKFDRLDSAEPTEPTAPTPGPELIVGLDGKDGNGVEYVFTCTEEEELPENRRPLNSWPFDQSSLVETSVNGQRWYDGVPPGVGVDANLELPVLSAECPVLWRSQRRVPGTPDAGTEPDPETWGEWSEPIIIGRYGIDGKPGPRGLLNYTHFVQLTNYELDAANVNEDEDWNFTEGDGQEWAENITLVWQEADADIIAAVNRIGVGTLITIFRDSTNWADYYADTIMAMGHRVTIQGRLAEKAGTPEFEQDGNGEIHFTPRAEVQIGRSGATVNIYKRSAARPADRPDDATYNFSTRSLTPTAAMGSLNGWSTVRPAGTERLWVRAAFAAGDGIVSDRIASNEWSEPVHDEAEDGISVWPLFLFQRKATKPTVKPGESTFNFDTRTHTIPNLNGWSTAIPDGNDPLWVARAVATSDDPNGTDTIPSDEWSIEGLARDGRPGTTGVRVFVYKRAATKPGLTDRPPDATYFFSTRILTPVSGLPQALNGWTISEEPPGNGRIWVRSAWASGNNGEDRDVIQATDWTSPIHDEAMDGINSTPLFLWKRSPVRPTVKPGQATYQFSTKTPTYSALNDWSRTIPAPNGNPLWIAIAIAASDTDTDTIPSSEWSIEPLSEDGKQGPSGYAASVVLENYQATAAAVNLDEEWFFTGGTSAAWPATIPVLTLRETDPEAIAAFRLVAPSSLIAIHRHQDSANFGEYRVSAAPTVADNGLVSFANLTRQRSEGSPNFSVGDTGEIHFNPKGEPGEGAEPDPVLGIIDARLAERAFDNQRAASLVGGGDIVVTESNRILVVFVSLAIKADDGPPEKFQSRITIGNSSQQVQDFVRSREYETFQQMYAVEVSAGTVTIQHHMWEPSGEKWTIKDALIYAMVVKKGDFTPSGASVTTSTVIRYALATSQPAAPANNVETPSTTSGAWTRTTQPAATTTQNVYQLVGTRTYQNGVFQSTTWVVTTVATRTGQVPQWTREPDAAVTTAVGSSSWSDIDYSQAVSGATSWIFSLSNSNAAITNLNTAQSTGRVGLRFDTAGTVVLTATPRNEVGNGESRALTITINAASTSAVSVVVTPAGPVDVGTVLTVTVTGLASFSRQWQRATFSIATIWSAIAGATGGTYTVPSSIRTAVRCRVTSGGRTYDSNRVNIN